MYIVLNPISNCEPGSFKEIYAKPRRIDRDTILTEFQKQYKANLIVRIFNDKDEALHYARTLSQPNRRPNVSGCFAPVLECNLTTPISSPPKELDCLSHDTEPGEPKSIPLPLMKKLHYHELSLKELCDVHHVTLTKTIFSNERIPEINLRASTFSCTIL